MTRIAPRRQAGPQRRAGARPALSQLAAEIGVSQNFLSDLECGKANGDVTLFGRLARSLEVRIDDVAPDEG